jgi:hypothetical protein
MGVSWRRPPLWWRHRGRSSMVEPQPSKLVVRVRFPSPASRRCRTTLRFISSVAERRGSLAFGVRVITTDGRRGRTVSHARTPEPHLARNAPGNFGRHGGYAYLGYWGFGCLSTGDLANPPQGDLLSSYTGWLTFVGAGLFTGSGAARINLLGRWRVTANGSISAPRSTSTRREGLRAPLVTGRSGQRFAGRMRLLRHTPRQSDPAVCMQRTIASTTSSCGRWTSLVTHAERCSTASGTR